MAGRFCIRDGEPVVTLQLQLHRVEHTPTSLRDYGQVLSTGKMWPSPYFKIQGLAEIVACCGLSS